MNGKKNLINLATIDQDKARQIRSLGGKARQQQRKRQLSIAQYFRDYMKVDTYFNSDLEKILDEKLELNSYQKDIIRKEFLNYLLERGYIRRAQLTEGEEYALGSQKVIESISSKDLYKYFRYRPKRRKKRSHKHGLHR